MPLDEVQVSVDAERSVLDEQPEERRAAGTALEVDMSMKICRMKALFCTWSQRTTGAVAGDCCAGKNQKKRLELHAFLLTVK